MPPIPMPNPSWLGLVFLSIMARFRKPKTSKRESSNEANGRLPTYSVLIPAHDEGDLIGEALKSCAKQTIKPQSVLILDDNSSCDYQKLAASIYPQAEIIRSNQRRRKAHNSTKNDQKHNSDYF